MDRLLLLLIFGFVSIAVAAPFMDALENLAEDELAKIVPEEKLAHCRKPGVNCDQKDVDQWQAELDAAKGSASSLSSSFMFIMIVAVAAVINYTN